MTNIYPTHTCFDDTKGFIAEMAWQKPIENYIRFQVCHGIMTLPDGTPYSHAWIKDNYEGSVIDFGLVNNEKIIYSVDPKEYYPERFVQEETVYQIREVLLIEGITRRSPWKKQYMELTKDPTEQKWQILDNYGRTNCYREKKWLPPSLLKK